MESIRKLSPASRRRAVAESVPRVAIRIKLVYCSDYTLLSNHLSWCDTKAPV